MRHALASLALAAVFIAGCSTVAPTFDGIDGATTTVAIATGADDLALPAGHAYAFETTGADIDKTWLAYGLTTAYVDVTTTTVRLALQTVIDSATLETNAPTSAVDPGQTIDLHLAVDAPGGYAVPVADYAATYAIPPDDGTIGATSKEGTRAVATVSPTDDTFTVTATITGWRDVAGVATMSDVTATFEAPYAIVSGLGFDTTAPVVTIDAATELPYAGSAYAVSGTASDDVALDRIHLYDGPVLVGSTDSLEHEADGVAPIDLLSGSWTVD